MPHTQNEQETAIRLRQTYQAGAQRIVAPCSSAVGYCGMVTCCSILTAAGIITTVTCQKPIADPFDPELLGVGFNGGDICIKTPFCLSGTLLGFVRGLMFTMCCETVCEEFCITSTMEYKKNYDIKLGCVISTYEDNKARAESVKACCLFIPNKTKKAFEGLCDNEDSVQAPAQGQIQ